MMQTNIINVIYIVNIVFIINIIDKELIKL